MMNEKQDTNKKVNISAF